MNTLLFRLVGPMQSWGSRSRFEDRDTHLEPTKSGVLGLVCAALGRERDQSLADLTALRMGVRIDAPGVVATDFQTAQFVARASGSGQQETVVSKRHYLADAMFWVALEGDDLGALTAIGRALANPRWLLCLGRKSFPLSAPPGAKVLADTGLEAALRTAPLLRSTHLVKKEEMVRIFVESDGGEIVTADTPVSFAKRQFALRHTRPIDVPTVELADIFV